MPLRFKCSDCGARYYGEHAADSCCSGEPDPQLLADGGREENLRLTYALDDKTSRTVGPVEKFGVLEGGALEALIRGEDRVVLSPSTDWFIEPMEWDDAT